MTATRTRSVSDRLRRFALVIAVLALACREAPPQPSLRDAFTHEGNARSRARAFLRVAQEGPPAERRRAAFLWGLYACDAGAPLSAVTAFAVAHPEGPLGRLAARRLTEALRLSHDDRSGWIRAAGSAWIVPADRRELLLSWAESLGEAGRGNEAEAVLRRLSGPADRTSALRVLSIRARLGERERADAMVAVARDFPSRFSELFPEESVTRVVSRLTRDDRLVRAERWLQAGRAEMALREGAALGQDGAAIAARAAIALRRPSTALVWADRVAGGAGDAWEIRCEAYRMLAWTSGSKGSRTKAFGQMLSAARRLAAVAGRTVEARAFGALFAAEALVELGRLDEARAELSQPGVRDLPRWEWVVRRLARADAEAGRPPRLPEGSATALSTRVRRVVEFWQADEASGAERTTRLNELASSGFPDLPALWAARLSGAGAVPVRVDPRPLPEAGCPDWAHDLVQLGRIADVLVAWRAWLEEGEAPAQQWVDLVRLAKMPAIDAIPLLVRGEPRLLSGPWTGLSRSILELYLPLPWRTELEEAARRAGVPPWVLAGVVRQESAWNPRATSAAGAVGLTQVLPSTAPDIARWAGRPDLRRANLFDPTVNLALGAHHLAQWHERYGSWVVAIACHNAGERRVRDAWEDGGKNDGPDFVEGLELPETWDYVHRVVLLAEGYRILYWPDGEAFPWT